MVPAHDPSNIRRILVIRLRAFGDTLLSTPTFRGFKKAYPHAKLSVLLEPAMAQVVEGLPYVDEVIPYDRLAWKKRGKLVELLETARFWGKIRSMGFDLVVDVLGTPRTAMLAWMSGAALRVGFGFRIRSLAYNVVCEPSKERKYIADYTADALRALGHEPDSLELDFHVPEAARAVAGKWLTEQGLAGAARPLVVQAAGGWELKRYPLPKLAVAVQQAMQASGRASVLLWGPGEEGMAAELAALIGQGSHVAPSTDFQGMGALLECAAVLLTNDNATKHLAVAVKCPTVTVFGPTSDIAWHPPADPRHVSVRLDLECMPCEALTCRLGTHECMQGLPEEKVAQAVLKVLR